MIVAQQADDVANEVVVGVDVDDVPAANVEPTLSLITPTTQPPPPSQELPSTSQVEVEVDKKAEVEENADVQGRPEESQAQIYQIDLEHTDKVLSMQDDELEQAKLKEVVEVVTTAKLMTKVVTAAATITAATSPITVATITATPKQVQRKEKEDDDVLRSMDGFKMDYFKGMSYDDICLIFKKYFNSNVASLEITKEQLEEEESRALKRTSKSLEEKATNKQKLNEEVEELKKHLQIVPNNDDDVYTEAIHLAFKVSVIDYEIYTENNKPYYKIIRADGTHQLFLSILSLLRDFDREDLEVLWQKSNKDLHLQSPRTSQMIFC
nr:hypothetical protein [Tanacetum cinerariifolium]